MSAIARGGGEALAFEDAELEGTVFARFERVAARFPARDAVRGAGGATSYRDLREAAAALAAALAERLGGESGPLALVADPGAPLFSAMLGALAAGRLYAPVDPKLPDARIEAILGELDPCAVVAGDAASAARAEGLCRGGPPIWTIGELVERRAGSVLAPTLCLRREGTGDRRAATTPTSSSPPVRRRGRRAWCKATATCSTTSRD
jgi:non-ribosomal peptide synthetase component F